MIRQSLAAMGPALAAFLFLSCRDAPTAVVAPVDSTLPIVQVTDSTGLPGPAEIYSAYTEISFYDGSRGGEPAAEFKVGMEYLGNRAAMALSWSMTGAGIANSDKILNQHDSFYDLRARKSWDELYTVPAERNCDLYITGRTQHSAWWFFWLRLAPNWESSRDVENTFDDLQLDPCPPEEPGNNGGGEADSGGGWIVVETCYYWAHYLNGVLIGTELRYCEYDQIPVADQ